MANIDAAIKKLEMLKSEYQDAIDHDETILVSTMFVLLRGVLEAMREPSGENNSRKRTIEIDREVAELWLRGGEDSDGEMVDEVKRALEAK